MDNKRYYYLKLNDNFFDSAEIKVLESMPNGVYYSNLLIKLYLISLKSNGALRFNEFIPYDENMIAVITNLNIDIVRSGLKVLSSMKLIDRAQDGTIYMTYLQNFIGKASSEADRKRIYREKIEEEKVIRGQVSDKCSAEEEISDGTISEELVDKRPPEIEIEKELDIDKDIDKEINLDTELKLNAEIEKNEAQVLSQSVGLLRSFEKQTGLIGKLNLEALKRAVCRHGTENVKKAIDKALEKNKPTMTYINGILKNWAIEGYPKEGEDNGNRSTIKDNGAGKNGFEGFKPKEPRTLRDEERKALQDELL